MRFFTPLRLLILGVALLILGVVLPLLMVAKIIESTYFLNFLAYAMSLAGTVFSTLGLAFYVRIKRNK